MANEEILFELSMLEQQAQELKQQIEQVNSHLNDLENLKLGLIKLEQTKEKEILAPLGRGIFIKSEAKEDEVFVNVGSRIVVKKSFKGAEEIIEKQISELERVKVEIERQMEIIESKFVQLVNSQ